MKGLGLRVLGGSGSRRIWGRHDGLILDANINQVLFDSLPCAGHYGADCSLSLGSNGRPSILEGLGYKPATRKPMVYIYEVPPRFNTWWVPGSTHDGSQVQPTVAALDVMGFLTVHTT